VSAKEIVLSAGYFQTPQILELSGIGSADILESKGIELIVDLPYVGENLQDHVVVGVSFEFHSDPGLVSRSKSCWRCFHGVQRAQEWTLGI
jgi:choline dehydrogenase-like flavoprotein